MASHDPALMRVGGSLHTPGRHFFTFADDILKIQREACSVSDSATVPGYQLHHLSRYSPMVASGTSRFFSSSKPSSLLEVMTVMVLTVFSLRITCVPGYDRLIKVGSKREGAILLDVGCCREFSGFGGDKYTVSNQPKFYSGPRYPQSSS